MPINVPIPNGIFQIGSSVFGPGAIGTDDVAVQVNLDRTVNQGMNTKTPATKVHVLYEIQLPGDSTWFYQGETTFEGGTRIDSETGQAQTLDTAGCSLLNPGQAGRSIRLTVDVSGSSVRLAGSVFTTTTY